MQMPYAKTYPAHPYPSQESRKTSLFLVDMDVDLKDLLIKKRTFGGGNDKRHPCAHLPTYLPA